MPEVGEYIAGAYLKLELGCDIVDDNVRPSGGGIPGLGELDVVGYDLAQKHVYLCEVTTHIRGLLIGGGRAQTIRKIASKHARQKEYAQSRLSGFEVTYQFWSPYVPRGFLTAELSKLSSLELIINGRYSECIEKLRLRAQHETHDAVNPFFRTLQILGCLRS